MGSMMKRVRKNSKASAMAANLLGAPPGKVGVRLLDYRKHMTQLAKRQAQDMRRSRGEIAEEREYEFWERLKDWWLRATGR